MLELSLIRIDGDTQSRVELNQEVVAEYAEAYKAGAKFPPVVVFFDGADRWLADGFHRYFGAKAAGVASIYEEVIPGTKREAVLYSLKANATHGLKRTNADKRKAVETLLADAEWSEWSDRKVAEVCGVSVSFVGAARRPEVAAKQKQAKASKEKPQSKNGCSPTTPQEPQTPEPVNHELQEAALAINELATENEQLRDRLSVAVMDGTEEEKADATLTISELREQVKNLEIELDATRASRDGYQRQNADLMKQVRMQQKQLKKLGG